MTKPQAHGLIIEKQVPGITSLVPPEHRDFRDMDPKDGNLGLILAPLLIVPLHRAILHWADQSCTDLRLMEAFFSGCMQFLFQTLTSEED